VKDLAKNKLGKFSKAIEAAQAAFRAEVDLFAEQARDEILPYFKKHGLGFVSGAGWGWSISKPSADTAPHYRPEDHVEDDSLPKNIRDLLNLEVGHNDQLGLHIRDIKRGEW
jgi:hypothetical protein